MRRGLNERRPDRQSPPHGSGVGPSGHEGVGAPNAVPPLAPTMSLTSSRAPHPSQLDPSPYRFALTPVVAIRANRANRSPRLLAYFLRLLSSRHPHSRPGWQRQDPWPHSTAFWPHPVLPLPPVAQVCSSSGAGLYSGWRRLDFIIQTGANRKRISPKRGAGMYTNLPQPHDKLAPPGRDFLDFGLPGVLVLEMVRFPRSVCTPGTPPEADFVYIHRGDVPLAPVCRGVCTPGSASVTVFVYIHRGDVPLAPVCRGVCTPGSASVTVFVYIHLQHNPDYRLTPVGDYPWRILTHSDTHWAFWCPCGIFYVVLTRIGRFGAPREVFLRRQDTESRVRFCAFLMGRGKIWRDRILCLRGIRVINGAGGRRKGIRVRNVYKNGLKMGHVKMVQFAGFLQI